MVLTSDEIVDDNGDKVISRGSGGECNLWTEDEISDNNNFKVINHSPAITNTGSNDSLNDFFSEISVDNEDINSVGDLIVIMDTSEDSVLKADGEVSEVALDLYEELKTSTFAAAILANSISSMIEIKLFDSGASRHMSPYQDKFINYFPIQKQVLTATDGGTFDAVGKGDMHVVLPNGKSTTKILLKDVLYTPKMGLTLISIGKIDIASFVLLFHKSLLRIFSCGKTKKS